MAPDEADALRLHRFKNHGVALFLRQLGLPPDTIRQPVRTPDFKKIAVGRIMEDAGEPVIPGRVVTWQNPHNLGRGKPVRGRTDWRTVNYAVPANERQGIKQHVISPIIRLNLQRSLLKSGFHNSIPAPAEHRRPIKNGDALPAGAGNRLKSDAKSGFDGRIPAELASSVIWQCHAQKAERVVRQFLFQCQVRLEFERLQIEVVTRAKPRIYHGVEILENGVSDFWRD